MRLRTQVKEERWPCIRVDSERRLLLQDVTADEDKIESSQYQSTQLSRSRISWMLSEFNSAMTRYVGEPLNAEGLESRFIEGSTVGTHQQQAATR